MNAEYLMRMEARLRQWDADVDALVDRGDRIGVGARAEHDVAIMGLGKSRDAAHRAFDRMRRAGDARESGSTLRVRMDGAWDEMRRALEDVSENLGKQ